MRGRASAAAAPPCEATSARATTAAGRPLAWIDDAFNAACHAWAGERAAATLLVRTEPELGLTAREAVQLTRWAQALQAGL